MKQVEYNNHDFVISVLFSDNFRKHMSKSYVYESWFEIVCLYTLRSWLLDISFNNHTNS